MQAEITQEMQNWTTSQLKGHFRADFEYIESEAQLAAKAASTAMEHARNAGQRLLEIRDACRFGTFESITAGMGITSQQRSIFMRVAENWAELQQHNLLSLGSPDYALRELRKRSAQTQHSGEPPESRRLSPAGSNSGVPPESSSAPRRYPQSVSRSRPPSPQARPAQADDDQPQTVEVQATAVIDQPEPDILKQTVVRHETFLGLRNALAAEREEKAALLAELESARQGQLPAALEPQPIQPAPQLQLPPAADERDELIARLQQQLQETQEKLQHAQEYNQQLESKLAELTPKANPWSSVDFLIGLLEYLMHCLEHFIEWERGLESAPAKPTGAIWEAPNYFINVLQPHSSALACIEELEAYHTLTEGTVESLLGCLGRLQEIDADIFEKVVLGGPEPSPEYVQAQAKLMASLN